jgi:hypothetical protein
MSSGVTSASTGTAGAVASRIDAVVPGGVVVPSAPGTAAAVTV